MKRLMKNARVGVFVALWVVFAGITAWAEVDGNWEFSYSDSDSSATVTKYTGSLSSPTIPSKVSRRVNTGEKDEDGEYIYRTYTYTVTSTAWTFHRNETITSVSLPSSVTNIGSHTFCECANLTEIAIPSSVKAIGASAFFQTRLRNIIIPDSVTRIENMAFDGCSNLTEVVIGNGVTNIDYQAFARCSKLTKISIPDSVTSMGPARLSLGGGIFSQCTSLKEASIGNNVTNMGHYTFYGCTSLETVHLGNKIQLIGSDAFRNCTNLPSLIIPNSAEKGISTSSFQNCTRLKEIVIPDSVTLGIGDWAFSNCTSLVKVTIGRNVPRIWTYAFARCTSLPDVTIPSSVKHIDKYAFYGCTNLSSITIEKGAFRIWDYAFAGCTQLKQLTIPDSVTNIASYAFSKCFRLNSVMFKGYPPIVGESPFSGVATDARGYYTAEHAEAWKKVIGTDGKWCGLIMEEMNVPKPELQVDHANPAEGSLTLAWVDEGGGEGVTYSVYRGAGESRAAAGCVTNGLTGNTWEDKEYWKAEPVMKPLNYWVVAKGSDGSERESNRVETRHRYGVFVGVGEYEESWVKQLTGSDLFEWKSDPKSIDNAELFGRLARENGFSAPEILTGDKATKGAFRRALQDVAEKTKTGDYVAVFCSSHGKLGWWYGKFKGIVMHDSVYEKKELSEDLETLVKGKNGLSVAIIFNTCYSGAALSSMPEGANMAWIVSCRESEETTTSSVMGSPLPLFLLEYGWNRGKATGSVGSMATLADLWNYAAPNMRKLRDMEIVDETPGTLQRAVLEHFIAGRLGSAQYERAPETPAVPRVEAGEGELTISWNHDAQAEYFILMREDANSGKRVITALSGETTEGSDDGARRGISYLPVQTYLYRVAALNEHGISEWSESQIGVFSSQFWQWLVEKVVELQIDESTPVEMVAAAAALTSANGMSYEECYVAGVDPADAGAALLVELVREDGKWHARPQGDKKTGRIYRVYGKQRMTDDEEWTDVTGVEDLEAEGWRFFCVGVELAE